MILAVPAATPVTTPLELFMVATNVVPLVHTPPEVASESVAVKPMQGAAIPAIAAGVGTTVTVFVVVQPTGLKP